MHVTHHPMQLLRAEAERFGCVPTASLGMHTGSVVRIAALIAATRKVMTRRGQPMQFITFEDEFGLVEAVIFPAIHTRIAGRLETPGPFLVPAWYAKTMATFISLSRTSFPSIFDISTSRRHYCAEASVSGTAAAAG